MRKKIETEIKVGLFVSVGLGLIMLSILLLGGDSLFTGKERYIAHFSRVDGLISGAKVISAGLPVGTVETISLNKETRDIEVKFTVEKGSIDWIRANSTVEIATQGVLGDKYISVSPGDLDKPALPPDSLIPVRPTKDISQFIDKGDQLMVTLNSIAFSLDRVIKAFEQDNRSEALFKGMASTAKNLSQATDKLNKELDQIQIKKMIGHLNQIAEKVDNGTGTLGALVNDPSLYYQINALVGGANRNRIIRNLVRQTIKKSGEGAEPEPSPTSNSK